MNKRSARLIATALSAVAVAAALRIVLRRGSARDTIRRFNRRVLNPLMLRRAGRRGWYASTIETVGRRSGRHYLTPVVAEPVVGGFVIPLPYGAEVDWLKNAEAAREADVRHSDVVYRVTRFRILTAEEAAPLLEARSRRIYGLFGVELFLLAEFPDEHLVVTG